MLPSGDARDIIHEFDITSEEEDYDYWIALQEDEAFTVACQRYKRAAIYADHEHATVVEQALPMLLQSAVFSHAERVREKVDR